VSDEIYVLYMFYVDILLQRRNTYLRIIFLSTDRNSNENWTHCNNPRLQGSKLYHDVTLKARNSYAEFGLGSQVKITSRS
jgi:hypothetical protein